MYLLEFIKGNDFYSITILFYDFVLVHGDEEKLVLHAKIVKIFYKAPPIE